MKSEGRKQKTMFECGFRNAECGMKKQRLLKFCTLHSAFRIPHSAILTACCLLVLFLLSACGPKVAYKDHPRLPKVALVLGGGAARGYAHVGVLRVLEEEKIPIDLIVGTSAGSVVAALYASGMTSKHMEEMGDSIDKWALADFTLPKKGLIKGEKLEALLNKRFKDVDIEQLRIPFAAVAADLKTGQRVVLKSGSVTKALRASCSVPGIFVPVEYNGMLLIDGGVVDQIPVEVAKELGADIVIAVDISKNARADKAEDIIDVMLATVDIMGAQLSKYKSKGAEVIIAPEVGHIDSTDFTKKRECILAGQLAATKALPVIYQAFDDYGAIAFYGKTRAQLKKN